MIWKDMSLTAVNFLTNVVPTESQTNSKSCKTMIYFFFRDNFVINDFLRSVVFKLSKIFICSEYIKSLLQGYIKQSVLIFLSLFKNVTRLH